MHDPDTNPLKAVSINVRFARAGEAFIVFDTRHARVSRFSKPTPPVRAKRLQWKIALKQALDLFQTSRFSCAKRIRNNR